MAGPGHCREVHRTAMFRSGRCATVILGLEERSEGRGKGSEFIARLPIDDSDPTHS
jgi:hypothetical protein